MPRFSLSRMALPALFLCLSACNIPDTPPLVPATTRVQQHRTPSSYGFVHQPSGSDTQYRVVSFNELPQWKDQPFAGSLQSFLQSCQKLASQSGWHAACQQATQTPLNHAAAKQFFEQAFTPWQVIQSGQAGGKITGYYEPVLYGDSKPTQTARFPIYGTPSDLISVPLPESLRNHKGTVRISLTSKNQGVIKNDGPYVADLSHFAHAEKNTTLKGRIVGNQFVPYFTRNQINAGMLNNHAPILGYANNAVDLFFLHIQGSGRLRTPSGEYIRLGYADHNGQTYQSIGKYMANRGYLPLAQTSMQSIKAWMEKNPSHLAEVLGQNPRYVFFRVLSGPSEQGPIGALGVPLTGEFSGAVDKRYITLGAPLFVATSHPNTPQYGLNRLLMAQDTGAAIKGAVRVDYFWGYGDNAGQTAGKQNYTGYVWMLLPHGVMPSYRP